MNIENSGASLTNAQIDSAERKMGVPLPSVLRDALVDANGGTPKEPLFVVDDMFYVVAEFLPLDAGSGLEVGSIVDYYLDLVLQRRLWPRNYLPFAIDPGGNFYLIDCSADPADVFVWYHDVGENLPRSLRASFVRFCGSLQESE